MEKRLPNMDAAPKPEPQLKGRAKKDAMVRAREPKSV